MTDKEKAEAYDKAYEIAEGIHRFSSNLAEIKRMEEIFPTLKEDEDERIRKELIDYLSAPHATDTFRGISWDKVVAWIQKQINKSYWKPSDYQMSCLEDAITSYKKRGYSPSVLTSLYDDLKKLKE